MKDMKDEALNAQWALGSFYEGPSGKERGPIIALLADRQVFLLSGIWRSVAERIVQDHNAMLNIAGRRNQQEDEATE